MTLTFWNYLLLYGLPVSFVLGILWGGVIAFKQEAEKQQPPAYDPDKYRS